MAKADIRIKLGKRMRQLRAEQGLTQQELAKRSGLSLPYIQMLEGIEPKRRRSATIVTLEKLSDGFGVSLSKLLDF
ncbi:MAG: helix-turn-helix transcriptional regulator [Candidatus Peregrinibacteria bacterium]|nr:helix-turn-helix transcriptional regulator [Candidatus Peregrinibacteria bacterium]MCB9808320.1 helix-turn-helix transcriptional regulator [Candidatus Peribacteria bacterium]